MDISPKQHRVDELQGYSTDSNTVKVSGRGIFNRGMVLHKPMSLSLPSNDYVNSILVLLSARFTNRYLVTRVIQCDEVTEVPGLFGFGEDTCAGLFCIMCLIVELGATAMVSNARIPLCTFAKPFIWHRDENASSASGSDALMRQPVETERNAAATKYTDGVD